MTSVLTRADIATVEHYNMPGPEVVLALKAVQVALDKLPVEKVFDKLPFYRPSEEDRQEASKDPAAKSTHPFPSEDRKPASENSNYHPCLL